jgi:hypothetical protein
MGARLDRHIMKNKMGMVVTFIVMIMAFCKANVYSPEGIVKAR